MEKPIYCPKCWRKVANYNGKSVANIEVKCRKCNKLIVYKPKENVTELANLPKRTTSSGKRFY